MRAGENRSRKTANALSSQPVVFISYSSEDRVIAEKVCRLLEGDGLPCWIAPRDVAPGHDFGEQIIDAIESTQVMVLILSAHANASIFVKREVERAISAGRVAIPLRIQEVQPSKALQLFISSTQWIDAWAPPLPARVHLLAAAIHVLIDGVREEPDEVPLPPTPDARSFWRRVSTAIRHGRGRSLGAVAVLGLVLLIAASALYGRHLGGATPGTSSTTASDTTATATATATGPASLVSGAVVASVGDLMVGAEDLQTGASHAKAIDAGMDFSLALKTDGTVVAWGTNDHGQGSVPSGLSSVSAIAAGSYHAVALKSDGTVVAWGRNDGGQTAVPAGLSGVKAIAAGGDFNLALKKDGTVVGWGLYGFGQINIPAGLSDVTAIAAGDSHSLALKSDGTVVGWGNNDSGQAKVPAGLTGVTAIAAGSYFSLALKRDGTVVAWGDGHYGQLAVPAGLSDVTAIAAGGYHCLALKRDKTVVAWGSNGVGQLAVPAGLSDVIAIAGGNGESLALRSDGTVVAWGAYS